MVQTNKTSKTSFFDAFNLTVIWKSPHLPTINAERVNLICANESIHTKILTRTGVRIYIVYEKSRNTNVLKNIHTINKPRYLFTILTEYYVIFRCNIEKKYSYIRVRTCAMLYPDDEITECFIWQLV